MKRVLIALLAAGGLLMITSTNAHADHWRRGRGSNFSISAGTGFGYGSGFNMGYSRMAPGRWNHGPWIGGVPRGRAYRGPVYGGPVFVPVPHYGYPPIYSTFPNHPGWHGGHYW